MQGAKSMKKVFIVLLTLMTVFTLYACGGGGGSGDGSTGAVQGSGLLAMNVDTSTIDTSPESGNDQTTVKFTLDDYSPDLPAFPVIITGYKIAFKRLDCSSCPAPAAFTTGSGLTVKSGETAEESITLISEEMKTKLPIAAMRNDGLNPINNQANITTSTSDNTQSQAETVAVHQTETIQNFSSQLKEEIATGDGSSTFFTYSVLYPPVMKHSVVILTDDTKIAVDNGTGQIRGTGINGSINYESGYITLTFASPPVIDVVISVEYQPGTGDISNPEINFTLTKTPIPGSVVIIDNNNNTLGVDDGDGNITGDIANGTVDYSNKSGTATLSGTDNISSVKVSYYYLLQNSLSLSPIVPGSIGITIGDQSCNDIASGTDTGTFIYPCGGGINYNDGAITDFVYYNTTNTTENIRFDYKVPSYVFIGGDRNLATGDGITRNYTLHLRYPPIEPPNGDYTLMIVTSDGQIVTDTGGTLGGDVCENVRSYVDHSTGAAFVCFSQPPSSGAEIYAFYKTLSMKLAATITAGGYEVGGNNISISRQVTISLN